MKIHEILESITPLRFKQDYRSLSSGGQPIPQDPSLDPTPTGDSSSLIRSAMKNSIKTKSSNTERMADISQGRENQIGFINEFVKQASAKGYRAFSFSNKWKEPAIRTKNGVAVKVKEVALPV